MGLVITEIELIRGNDIALVEEGFLEAGKIRSIKVVSLSR